MLCPISPTPVPLLHDNSPFGCSSLDDDDAILQAVLMASLEQEGMSDPDAADSEAVQAQAKLLSQMERPALVGPPGSLSAYAAETSAAGPMRAALQALGAAPRHLAIIPVRGDGHCFFRAFAASLARRANPRDTPSWSGMLREFEAHIDTLREPCAAPAIAALRHLLGRNGTDAPLDALNEEAETLRSDAMVAALRKCATDYMRAHESRFAMVADGDLESFESYCSRMEAMAPRIDGTQDAAQAAAAIAAFCPAYGGQPEMVALSEALRVRIEIIDMGEAGAASSEREPTTYTIGDELDAATPLVTLLRRGLHFHLLLPAAAEGEALALAGPMPMDTQ